MPPNTSVESATKTQQLPSEAAAAAWSSKFWKVEVAQGPDGVVCYRPVLKVKGARCDLGEYASEKEAAIAYDVAKLKVAVEHGLESQAVKLNQASAVYEGHPLFSYLLRECTLEDACRLLREGLVEEFLERERPKRHAAQRVEPELSQDSEPAQDAAPSPAQLPEGGTPAPTNPAAAGGAPPNSSGNGEGLRLKSVWKEEPAGSGRYLLNCTGRMLSMHEISLPTLVRQEVFGKATEGSMVTIRAASEDARWFAEYHQYFRSVTRTDSCLRQLNSLMKDNQLQPNDVLGLRLTGDLELSLEVHRHDSKEACDYIASIASQAALPSPSIGHSSKSRKRSTPSAAAALQQKGGPAAKKQRTEASAVNKENASQGSQRLSKPTESGWEERAVLSPNQARLLPAPPPQARSLVAAKAARKEKAAPAPPSKPSALPVKPAGAKHSSSKGKTSWAEFPPGSGRHAVVLSEAACRNSNLNITVHRAGQLFGKVQDGVVFISSTDTGKQHTWTYRQYNSNSNQVYLHALTEYMKCVKANPGDVLCLKNLSDGCAEVTLWKKSNQGAKAFVTHLHSDQAGTSPPAKAAPTPAPKKATPEQASPQSATKSGSSKAASLGAQAALGPSAGATPVIKGTPSSASKARARPPAPRPSSAKQAPTGQVGTKASAKAMPAGATAAADAAPPQPEPQPGQRVWQTRLATAAKAPGPLANTTAAAPGSKQPAARLTGPRQTATKPFAHPSAATQIAAEPVTRTPAAAAAKPTPAAATVVWCGPAPVLLKNKLVPSSVLAAAAQPHHVSSRRAPTTRQHACSSTPAQVGSKRRKQLTPHRAATGDPDTMAYVAAIAEATLPAKRARTSSAGDQVGGAAGGSAPTSSVPSVPAGSVCSYRTECMEGDSEAAAVRGPCCESQLASTFVTASNISAALSMQDPQAHAAQQMQMQQPLASPAALLLDEQGVWANVTKLTDLVVAQGQLSVSEAAAFQSRFSHISDPGAR